MVNVKKKLQNPIDMAERPQRHSGNWSCWRMCTRSCSCTVGHFLLVQLLYDLISSVRRLIHIKLLESWDKKYNLYKNVWLKRFIPSIYTRLKLDSKCFVTPELLWFVSGHGPYQAYLGRMGIAKDETCSCDAVRQDPQHLMLDWPITATVLKVRKIRSTREAFCIGEIIHTKEGFRIFESACLKITKLVIAINKEFEIIKVR